MLAIQSPQKRRSPDILRDIVNSPEAKFGRSPVAAYRPYMQGSNFVSASEQIRLRPDRFPPPFTFISKGRKTLVFDHKLMTDFEALDQIAKQYGQGCRVYAVTLQLEGSLAREAMAPERQQSAASYVSERLVKRTRHRQKKMGRKVRVLEMIMSIEGGSDDDPSRLHAHMAIAAHEDDIRPGGYIWLALHSIGTKGSSALLIRDSYSRAPVDAGWASYISKHNPRSAGRYYCSTSVARESMKIYQSRYKGYRFIRKLNSAAIKNERFRRNRNG